MSRMLFPASVAGLMLVWTLAGAQSPSAPITPPSPGAVGTSAAPTTLDPADTLPAGRSVWRSQDGSTVELTIDAATGALEGTFLPGFACGAATDPTPQPQPIVGTVLGNALTWTASLPGCPSVGTWIGHLRTVGTAQQLSVLWTLALPESPPGVGSTLAGSALFVRQGP